VAAVLNAPVVAIGVEDFIGVGLFERATGDAVGGFSGNLPGFIINTLRSITKAWPT